MTLFANFSTSYGKVQVGSFPHFPIIYIYIYFLPGREQFIANGWFISHVPGAENLFKKTKKARILKKKRKKEKCNSYLNPDLVLFSTK